MAKLPGLTEYYATLGAPAINFGRGLLGYQDPVGTETMQNRMREIEAGRTKGNVGYDEYGLTPSAGRFTGGLMDLAVNNPADFALAGSVGKYDFSPEGRTGLKYDFTPDQDTGSTGSAMLDFINAGGLKGAFSRMGTAQASEMPIEPMSDLERDFPGMSTGDIIDSMNNRPFIGNQQTGIMQQAPTQNFEFLSSAYEDENEDDQQVDYLPGQPKSFKDSATLQEYFQNRNPLKGVGSLLGLITGNPIFGLISGGARGLGALNNKMQNSMFGQSKNLAEYFNNRKIAQATGSKDFMNRPRSERNYTGPSGGNNTGGDRGAKGAADSFSNKSGMGRTGY